MGRLAARARELRIVERTSAGCVELTTGTETRRLGAAELEEIVVASLSQRGEHLAAGDTSDVLRAVGLALDELHARDVCLVLSADHLSVGFSDQSARTHELSYAGDELEALRRAAVARRNGQPLRRILLLQARPAAGASVIDLLVAEFAVQALPTPYARAIAATAEPPHLVLAEACDGTLEAVRTLRAGARTADVPILVMANPACRVVADDELFAAGVDDVLQEPVQPAQLRARIRTSLLRGRGA